MYIKRPGHHPLHTIESQRGDWHVPGACRIWHDFCFCRISRDLFRSLDRRCRLEVLSKSKSFSFQLSDVAGPVVAMRQRRRRYKYLVMVIHLSYLVFDLYGRM